MKNVTVYFPTPQGTAPYAFSFPIPATEVANLHTSRETGGWWQIPGGWNGQDWRIQWANVLMVSVQP